MSRVRDATGESPVLRWPPVLRRCVHLFRQHALGRRIRYRLSDLEAFLASRTVGTVAQ
jgi:hypothetical protein